jgi:hypothetical protein
MLTFGVNPIVVDMLNVLMVIPPFTTGNVLSLALIKKSSFFLLCLVLYDDVVYLILTARRQLYLNNCHCYDTGYFNLHPVWQQIMESKRWFGFA